MATPPADAVAIIRIEHPDGRRYAVTEQTYEHTKLSGLGGKTYKDAGFKVVSYEDGTKYGGTERPTRFALVKGTNAPAIGVVPEGGDTTPEPAPAPEPEPATLVHVAEPTQEVDSSN